MYIYNLTSSSFETFKKNKGSFSINENCDYFISCYSNEIALLQKKFGFDQSTIDECNNFDENVRFTSYPDYDFISLISFGTWEGRLDDYELNMYIGKFYVVLVLPVDQKGFIEFENYILQKATSVSNKGSKLNRIYFIVLDKILTDISNTLEIFEDELTQLESRISADFNKELFDDISRFRSTLYVIRKHLRTLLYVGDQFRVNENEFIEHEYMRFFASIDIRANKLFDFSESLHEFTNQLLHLYESKLSMKTNDTITKLTAITMIFGPPTVIAGIYGMNFDFMPELSWKYGYPMVWACILIISIVVYTYFKRNKWL